MRQVITISPKGEVQHTLKDSFFDTRFLGNRKVERMTEILHDDDKQKFYIKWLVGPKAGTFETVVPYHAGIRYFDTYEEAVACEIEAVNELRLAGHDLRSTTDEKSAISA